MKEGKKIYNKVVIDMETDEVVEEDSFIYSGPLALCDGEEDFSGFDEGGEESDEGGEEPEGEEEEADEGGEGDEDESDEEDPSKLKQRLEQLQAQMEELTEMSTPKEGEQNKQDGPPEYEAQQFIKSDDELDGVLNSAEGFNNAMNSAVQTAIQHVYKGLPGVVKNNVAQQIQLQETVSGFYQNNPELKKHRSFVGKVSERIMSENPDWSMQKVLDETAKEARKRLKLKQKAETKDKSNNKNPGFAKGGKSGGKKGSQGKLSGQEKQIADMLSVTDT